MTPTAEQGPAFQLLAAGPWSQDDVRCTLVAEPMCRNAETERLIAEAWDKRARFARERGQLFFPGPMCGLRAWVVDGEALELRFGLTDYREFVGTNVAHPEFATRFGEAYLSNGAGVCTVIETTDAQLVLHRRSNRVFEHPGRLHFCGGALEPVETATGLVADPFAVMRNELWEEMDLPPAAIAEMRCLGLARDGVTLKPEVLLQTRLAISSAQITATTSAEYSALVFVPVAGPSLNAWLQQHWDEIAPAGQALLAAYLACSFAAAFSAAWR